MKNDPIIRLYHAIFESDDTMLMMRGFIIVCAVLFIVAALGYIVDRKLPYNYTIFGSHPNKLMFLLFIVWGASPFVFAFFMWFGSALLDGFLWLSFTLGAYISYDTQK